MCSQRVGAASRLYVASPQAFQLSRTWNGISIKFHTRMTANTKSHFILPGAAGCMIGIMHGLFFTRLYDCSSSLNRSIVERRGLREETGTKVLLSRLGSLLAV